MTADNIEETLKFLRQELRDAQKEATRIQFAIEVLESRRNRNLAKSFADIDLSHAGNDRERLVAIGEGLGEPFVLMELANYLVESKILEGTPGNTRSRLSNVMKGDSAFRRVSRGVYEYVPQTKEENNQ